MQKKRLLTIVVASFTLISCGGATSSSQSESKEEAYDISWVTPQGAPTLAFYDQGENQNWLSTATPASVIPGAFVANNYDAIVFDGLTGLNLLKKNGEKSHYALARWVNELPFYLVSVKHGAEEEIDPNATIDAFVQTGAGSQALRRLAEDAWGVGELTNVTYEEGVNVVQSNLVADANSFDYFVLAEPVYTLTKATLANKSITLNTIKDLQSDWLSSYNAHIPSAGLFINTDSLAAHPNQIKQFVSDFDARVDNLVKNPSVAKDALLAFEAKKEGNVAAQFGVGLPIINQLDSLQQANKLGFLNGASTKEANQEYANLFAGALTDDSIEETYSIGSFIDI